MKMPRNTQYLASFMIGMGTMLNIAPVFANINQVGSPKDDSNNLRKDWQNVGSYLYNAMDKVSNDRSCKTNR